MLLKRPFASFYLRRRRSDLDDGYQSIVFFHVTSHFVANPPFALILVWSLFDPDPTLP